MKAAEASRLSNKNATAIAVKKAQENLKKQVAEKKNRVTRSQKFTKKFEEDLRTSIQTAIEYGEKSISRTLSEDNRDYAAGDHVYHEGLYARYLEKAKYRREVKKVITKLRRDGYKVEIVAEWTTHDTSAAYLNSGGEMGSETPYHTNDNILKISWGKQ